MVILEQAAVGSLIKFGDQFIRVVTDATIYTASTMLCLSSKETINKLGLLGSVITQEVSDRINTIAIVIAGKVN
jgi:hypothetical protein